MHLARWWIVAVFLETSWWLSNLILSTLVLGTCIVINFESSSSQVQVSSQVLPYFWSFVTKPRFLIKKIIHKLCIELHLYFLVQIRGAEDKPKGKTSEAVAHSAHVKQR